MMDLFLEIMKESLGTDLYIVLITKYYYIVSSKGNIKYVVMFVSQMRFSLK